MAASVDIPVTVKHRIGVDDHDRYEDMLNFVDTVADAGCRRFTVHARKAWLQGLSPRENREVPPLRYVEVYRLAAERPGLHVEINGGIQDLDEAEAHLERVGGCMIGRAAWDDPFIFSDSDRRFFGVNADAVTRRGAIEHFLPHMEREIVAGRNPTAIVRNILNLHAGRPGTRRWKRNLTELCQRSRDAQEFRREVLAELSALEELQARH
jgi:tRNA-dihydrouridine synthase A